jgi:hypothetical protein
VIQEIASNSYVGVRSCTEPIAVTKRIAVLFDQIKQRQSDEREDLKTRAFTLGCKVCDGESVYDIREVQEFDGHPGVK